MAQIHAFLTLAAIFFLGGLLETNAIVHAAGLLPGWTSLGCFDDNSGFKTPATPTGFNNRTLKAQYLINATAMTPNMCMEYCSNFKFPYGFAGVEAGTECFCDGVIQLTANQTAIGECDTPCAGDSTLTCGGSKRIEIFTDGTPSPKIPTLAYQHIVNQSSTFTPQWQYLGCYSDNAINRTLKNLLPSITTDLSADKCVLACQNFIDFPSFDNGANPPTLLFSGLEAGNECWCGTALSPAAKKLPNIACESLGCLGSNDQACGGDSAMLVYQLSPGSTQDCTGDVDFGVPFHLNIVFLNGEPTVPVTMTSLVTHTNNFQFPGGEVFTSIDAGILSYCPSCPTPVTFSLDTDSQWELQVYNLSNTAFNHNVDSVVHPGGTVNFVEITDDDSVFLGYCDAPGIHPNKPQLTAFFAHAVPPVFSPIFGPAVGPTFKFTSFMLCSNVTAGGRLDVVFRPLAFMTDGYNLVDCKDIALEVDFNVTVPAGVTHL